MHGWTHVLRGLPGPNSHMTLVVLLIQHEIKFGKWVKDGKHKIITRESFFSILTIVFISNKSNQEYLRNCTIWKKNGHTSIFLKIEGKIYSIDSNNTEMFIDFFLSKQSLDRLRGVDQTEGRTRVYHNTACLWWAMIMD